MISKKVKNTERRLSIKLLVFALAITAIHVDAAGKDTERTPATDVIQVRKPVKGKVADDRGEPLPGATVTVEGSTRGVATDMDGTFSIDVDPADRLVIQYLGMETQTVTVGNRDEINIELVEKSNLLDEVTVVAFATQKKESVIASVTAIDPTDLKVPSSNLTTAFAGRISGLISYQRTGEPGQDNADFFIRGVTTFGASSRANPLILIDGVEMTTEDLSRLTTDDIASFSIMKDANATALYGARGANGVILVTTKEGKEGTVRVQFRMEGAYSTPTEKVKLADPVTYMRLHNEAVRTRDPMAALPYSTAKIVNTEKAADPLRYPALDWQNILFNDYTFNQRYNLNISGGGKIARYYIAAAYSKDNGIIKKDSRNNFNNNIDIDRYILRTNVNINLTKTTEAIVRLYGAFDDYSGPLDGGTALYKKAMHANPVLFHPYYPADKANEFTKHTLFGNYDTGNHLNPYSETVKGYKTSDRSNMFAQFELKQNLDFITKGLSIRGLFNVSRYSLLEIKHSFRPFFYQVANTASLNDYRLTALNPDTGTDYLAYDKQPQKLNSTMYFEGAAQYSKEIDRHNLSGLLVYTLREYLDGNANNLQLSLPYRNVGLAGRLTYGYDSRYFLEMNFGYNGSERFAKNERFGFFPSIGTGWIVSNEKFMEPYLNTVSKLKLKATYGLVGNDNIGEEDDRFFYLSQVNMSDNNKQFTFGDDFNYTRSGISISRYADPNITWEVSRKMNLGLELNLWNSLEFLFDYFTEQRTNILQTRVDIPTTMGLQASPQSNIGEAKGHGFDMSADYNKYFNKDLWAMFSGNFTYAVSKYQIYEEPDYAETPWRSHVNRKISQRWGYVAERLFLDDEEVKNSPKQMFGDYGAGDIKYKDINGDNRIDENDLVPIGYPTTPEIIYGFGVTSGYRNVDVSFFFQGSGRSSFWINPEKTAPFVRDGDDNDLKAFDNERALLQHWADSYWSEENRDIFALWPRLSNTAVANNQQTSTWFMRNGSFLRLKTVEIGYSLPKRWLKPVALDNVRLYVTGSNLFVLSYFKMWDPEMVGNGFSYPLQRVFNFGVNVQF
ncbi:MAG: TonB-dependent receptor [Tannerella sp.]|jgi:TonB-linked SusC/RagA family outer membrane protein|nr:TonB-dependent receptor [Tannerella sp.]